ncbi:MAG TPA: cytochrome c oxidase assembly factor Coa1 family protein [Candidatus Angelobacter sp.]
MSYGYAPTPLPPPPMARPNWFSRNWKWFIPTVVLGPILLLALFVGGVLSLVSSMMKSSEPYQHAMAVATHDARVTAQLGVPLRPGWFVTGSINESGPSGSADLSIPLRGQLRHSMVYVVANRSGGIWSYQTLEVEIEGEPERINLLPTGGTPQEPAEEK